MVESLPEGIDKIQIGSGVYNVKSYAEVGQEEQGLNSVYDTDTTVKLVADIVNEINQITQMK